MRDIRRHLVSLARPTQAAWAKDHGISPGYVSDVIQGRREPGKAMLKALGWERVVIYRPVKAPYTVGHEKED